MHHELDSQKATRYGSMVDLDPEVMGDERTVPADTPDPSHRWAFVAGCLYAVIIACGMISEVSLRGGLIQYEDADETIANIQASPASLRWSLMLDLAMSLSDVALSILLGAVLWTNGANVLLTVVAMTFRIVQQAILATNLLHLFAASLLLDTTLQASPVLATLFDATEAESHAMLFLYVHKYGYALALIFFGVSMLLLGVLIWQSRVLPAWLGVASGLAGAGYILDSASFFLVNGYTGEGTASSIYMVPVFVAELGLAGWLLFRKPVRSK